MNALARQMLKILEDTPLKSMSIHLLNKQCEETGLDIEMVKAEDLAVLISRLEKILPFFIGGRTNMVIEQFRNLEKGGIRDE